MKFIFELLHDQGSIVLELMVNPCLAKMDSASARASGDAGSMPFWVVSVLSSARADSRLDRNAGGSDENESSNGLEYPRIP